MQSGMVQSHHGTPSHPHTMMLMATQAPAGHQAALPQGTLNPIPVSSATHYSYTLTPGKSRSQINTSESERDLLQSMLTLKMYAYICVNFCDTRASDEQRKQQYTDSKNEDKMHICVNIV